MDSDEEDFVFYGTPIEREEENISRKKKAEAESSGQLRTVVPWKQEVLASLPCFFFRIFIVSVQVEVCIASGTVSNFVIQF